MQLLHLDGDVSPFFLRQLEYIQTKILEVPHKPLKFLTLVPPDMSADNAAETITYRTFDFLGSAKIVADYANDFPRADIYGFENSVKVKSLGAAFGFSIQEIRRARRENLDLETRRAKAAKDSIDRRIDKLGWFGNVKAGLQGFLKYPGTLQYIVPNGAYGGTNLKKMTVDEIIAVINGMISYVRTSTTGVEDIDSFIMTLDFYSYISGLRMPTISDKTLLTWLRDNFPQIKTWAWAIELTAAGTNGSNMIIGYTKDPDKLNFQIPQTFEQFAPQLKGLEYEVFCHARVGGVIMYRPMSCVWAEYVTT